MPSVLETLVVKLEGEFTDLEKDLRAAERTLRRLEGTAEETSRGMQQSFKLVGGALASLGFAKITQGLARYAVQADNAAKQTRVFENTLNRNSVSITQASSAVNRLSDRFGVLPTTVQEASTVLVRAGADVDQIETLLTAAGASAAAAGFDISTAFSNVAVAVATGRSELLETSGIVTNFSTAYKDFADEVGKSTSELSDNERIAAAVKSIYAESAGEVADLDVLLGGLTGSQARLNRQFAETRLTIGGVTQDALAPLIEIATGALGLFNTLPEPVQRAAVAFISVGAAVGTVGAALPAVIAGINALKVAIAPLLGPAGLILLGVSTVAALALAFSGGGPGQSLDASIKEAVAQLGNTTGSVDTFLDSLGSLETDLTGPALDAWARYTEGVIEGKDAIVDVEEAAKQAAETLARLAFVQELFASAGEFTGGGAARGIARAGVTAATAALGQRDPAAAAAALQSAIDALSDPSRFAVEETEIVNALRTLRDSAVTYRDAAELFAASATGSGGAGSGTRGGGRRTETRGAIPTAEDRRTSAAISQVRRFETEELQRQATRQFELIGGAFDLLGLEVEAFVRDLENITLGGAGGGRLIAPAAFRPAPPRPLEPFTPVPALPPTPRPALPGGLPGGFIPGPVGGISSPRIRQRAPLEPIPFEDILAIQNSINAAGAALTTAIQGVADNVEAARTPLAVAADNLDRIRIAEPGAPIPALPGITPALPGFAPGSQLTAAQQGIISGTVTPTGAVKVNVENLGTISGAAGRELLEPRGQPLTLGELVAQFGPIREPTAVPRGREIPEEQAEIIEEGIIAQREAAIDFRDTIINSALRFTDVLIQGIKDGDIGSIITGGLQTAAQIAGAIPGVGQPISVLLQGSSALGPVGGPIGAALGLIPGIFGSIFGRRREEESAASRAASRTPPSLEFNFTVNQTNSLGGITDPQTTVRLNELTNDVLRQGEELIRRTVLPRLQALETATGLDNV